MEKSTELLNNILNKWDGWEAALLNAEEQKAEAEKRAARMRATASVIRKMITDGEPWPGDQQPEAV
jgi:hypothetical protein